MASRSEERANVAIKAIEKGQDMGMNNTYIDQPRSKTPGKVIFLPVDLTDLGSVGTFVEELTRRETRIHVLFANAGIMAT